MRRASRAALAALLAALAGGVARGGPALPPPSPTASQAASAPGTPPASAAAPSQTRAAVVFEGRTLFYVSQRVGSFTAAERAAAISERLHRIATKPFSREVAVEAVDRGGATDITADGIVVLAVTEADAGAAGRPRAELARQLADRVREAVALAHKSYTLKSLLLGLLFALIATVVLVAFLKLIQRIFPAAIRKLRSWRGTVIRGFRLQKLEILTAGQIVGAFIAVLRLIRLGLILLLLFLYVPLVFSFFPWTRGLSRRVFGYVLAPFATIGQTAIAYLPKLLFLVIIIVLTRFAIRLVRFVFEEIGEGTIVLPGFEKEWARPTYKIVRFLVIAFAAVIAFPYVPGSESPAFKGISIFLGVLISLSSTSAIANIVAGVILTYTGAFRIGDRVKIADTVGDVIEKTLLVTRVRTIKNVEITIPNSMVLSSHIVNFSASAQEEGLILNSTVTIGYDAPWREVHELLIAAAAGTDGVLASPAPFVYQTALNDFFVSYEINAYTRRPSEMARIYSDLHENIQERFNQAGVEIMSPHYAALRDGNALAIPEAQRPKGYEAPGFRIAGPGGPPRKPSPDGD
jgi:small-conductance mechanosensitive channel